MCGEKQIRRFPAPSLRDHPRMCGEKGGLKIRSETRRGSPPHVRGKDGTCPALTVVEGITPACAGKSTSRTSWVTTPSDHPRMCGEKRDLFPAAWSYAGSPPHVRGKGVTRPMMPGSSRITPACAGKRVHGVRGIAHHRDHPRMCGEKLAICCRFCAMRGSPPHVRGKANQIIGTLQQKGITPACAGKRQAHAGFRRGFGDHPRMCGEKLVYCHMPKANAGITPACAGKRTVLDCCAGIVQDHPRMCGEKTV